MTSHIGAFLDIISTFVYLKIFRRLDRAVSNTAYSDLQFFFLAARDGWGNGAIMEIGSFKGKSAVALALGSKRSNREKVVCVDPHMEGTREIFLNTLRMFNIADKVTPCFATSEEARRTFSEDIRFIFIDGDHSYEAVHKDIMLWKDLVIDGGIIAFHDYYFPGVAAAIDELIRRSPDFIVEEVAGCTLIVSKREQKNGKLIEKVRLFNAIKEALRPWKKKGAAVHAGHFSVNAIDEYIGFSHRHLGMAAEKEEYCRDTLRSYLLYITGRPLGDADAVRYLEGRDIFLIESFSGYLDSRTRSNNPIIIKNNRLFRESIRKMAVTDKDYDERVDMQGIDFQVKHYYEPTMRVERERIDTILKHLSPMPKEKVLDVGCGVGTFTYWSARAGAHATGIDYSIRSIEVARKLAERYNTTAQTDFKCCDIVSGLPYEDGTFDKIVAADFIEHIDHDRKKKIIIEMGRVLKPGGRIVIFTPNAFREAFGSAKATLVKYLGRPAPETRLHYGLANRFEIERLLRNAKLSFARKFIDIERPYLAKMPIINEFLSLDLLWVAQKETCAAVGRIKS